eukprot:645342-Rhodomonas_salina.1
MGAEDQLPHLTVGWPPSNLLLVGLLHSPPKLHTAPAPIRAHASAATEQSEMPGGMKGRMGERVDACLAGGRTRVIEGVCKRDWRETGVGWGRGTWAKRRLRKPLWVTTAMRDSGRLASHCRNLPAARKKDQMLACRAKTKLQHAEDKTRRMTCRRESRCIWTGEARNKRGGAASRRWYICKKNFTVTRGNGKLK